MEETFESSFQESAPKGRPIIQIAEPFDGVDHSYLNTSLLADDLAKKNYRVVSLVGRNSGPKYGNNLLDLAVVLLYINMKDPCIKRDESLLNGRQKDQRSRI